MKTGVHLPFKIIVLSECMPRNEIASSYGNSIFRFFQQFPFCLPQWQHQLIFSPMVWESCLFSIPSPAFVTCRAFSDGHSEVILDCSFICFSLVISDVEHLFMRVLAICMSYLEKLGLLPIFLIWLFVFCCELYELFVHFRY